MEMVNLSIRIDPRVIISVESNNQTVLARKPSVFPANIADQHQVVVFHTLVWIHEINSSAE